MAQNDTARDIAGTFSHMKKNGILKILTVALIAGVALFVIGSLDIGGKSDKSGGEETEAGITVSFFEYKSMLEEEIESLCLGVSGVEGVSAVVFFDDVGGSVYAQNVQSGSAQSYKSEYVIIGSGSSSHALYLGEELPTPSGIGVVCRTGGDINKCNELVALLSAAYGLPMNRIYVTCQ